jgi:acetylornithine deacetylase/succinyl-diaminopimelate desuccinylase-like protein
MITERSLIPGFYNDIRKLTPSEISEIKKVQKSAEEEIKDAELFGIGGGEEKYSLGERKWTQPTLDVNGIWSGYQGEGSKTIIPAYACAKISMRLVPDQDNDKIYSSFEKYVKTLVPGWVKTRNKKNL